MAEITIEFTGQIRDLNDFSLALFETERLGVGTQKEIPDGGTITMRPMMVRKAYGIPQYIEVVLSTGGSVGAGIASNYICDKLRKYKGQHLNIRINRRVVLFSKRDITKMIEEETATQRK
jgi:hypothetical protein